MFFLQQTQFMTLMYTKKLINDWTVHGKKNVLFLPVLYYNVNDRHMI